MRFGEPDVQGANRGGRAAVGASLFSALSVTIGLWTGWAWPFAWFIWIIVFLVTLLFGLPLYALAARFNLVNAWTAAAGGAAAALMPTAWLLLSAPTANSTHTAAGLVAFGWCGAASGLLFLLILRWPTGRRRITIAVAGTSVIAFAAAWIAQDHSCHNPVWYGRGIAPDASFRLLLPLASWRDIAAEMERFGQAAGWSHRREQTPTIDQPWLRITICHADGTDIEILGDDDRAFEVVVYQPQGGDSWQPPMRALHNRMRARWVGRIDYRDRLGEPTRQPPDWIVGPAIPAPSVAVR